MPRQTYCDVSFIRAFDRGIRPSVDDVTAANAEAAALAHAAFMLGEARSLEHAERVLYALNVYNAFAPPDAPILAVMWANLASAKRRSVLGDTVEPVKLSFETMADVIQSAVDEADRCDHAVLDDVDERGLMLYAKNWYTSTHGFEEQLISTLHRASRNVRQMVYANLGDELGAEAVPHVELRARTLRNFHVAYDADAAGVLGGGDAFTDAEIFTEAFALSNTRTVFSQMPDAAYSLGCFYTIEACFPAVCRRILSLLRRHGVTDDALYYWALHGEADEQHSAEWLRSIQQAGLTDDVHARIARGAVSHLRQRHALFQALAAHTNPLAV